MQHSSVGVTTFSEEGEWTRSLSGTAVELHFTTAETDGPLGFPGWGKTGEDLFSEEKKNLCSSSSLLIWSGLTQLLSLGLVTHDLFRLNIESFLRLVPKETAALQAAVLFISVPLAQYSSSWFPFFSSSSTYRSVALLAEAELQGRCRPPPCQRTVPTSERSSAS